uniref:uncharacterized protein LOC641480 n=1 Tax=Danio rerio TaxID=7955 RepID=UPI00005E2D8B|nr:uncharacterized protein LOC641480 [Danio rerio]
MTGSKDVYIVAGARTPIGSFMGCLSKLSASELGSVAIAEALKRADVKPEEVDEVIMGQILTSLCGANTARQAAYRTGIPFTVPAVQVNQLCASGLRAVVLGSQAIQCGDSKIVVSGGMESMSQSPHAAWLRPGIKMNDTSFQDTMMKDALNDPFFGISMGMTAENVAKQCGISRAEQDEFAACSQQKTETGVKKGVFKEEIVPVTVPDRKCPLTVTEDEFPRSGTTVQTLSKLRPCFETDGTGSVTAGNSSGINDGAAAVVLMSAAEVVARGVEPLGRIVSHAMSGIDPRIMGLGPIEAVRKALLKADWTIDSVDLFEINEAFAAQSIGVIRELKLDLNKVNVNGGAIALGHPVGSSGARILVSLLYALRKMAKKRGVASLCVGGGMGIAICVERP